jgi:hypothetical protein
MIVTFRVTARSRAATRSPRSISRGAAGATVKGLPWDLRLTPLVPVTQSGHLLSRYQASARAVKPRANPPFCCTLMIAPPRSRPVLRSPAAANHHDPVMTSYLPRSDTWQRASLLPRGDTWQRASLRRRGEKEEFMMRNNVQRLGEHVTAALLGQVTPRSAEVAIVAGRGDARDHAPTATLAAGAIVYVAARPGIDPSPTGRACGVSRAFPAAGPAFHAAPTGRRPVPGCPVPTRGASR